MAEFMSNFNIPTSCLTTDKAQMVLKGVTKDPSKLDRAIEIFNPRGMDENDPKRAEYAGVFTVLDTAKQVSKLTPNPVKFLQITLGEFIADKNGALKADQDHNNKIATGEMMSTMIGNAHDVGMERENMFSSQTNDEKINEIIARHGQLDENGQIEPGAYDLPDE